MFAHLEIIEVEIVVQDGVFGDGEGIPVDLLGHALLVADGAGVEGLYGLVCIEVSTTYLPKTFKILGTSRWAHH